jgi:hypothetical protein
MRKIVENLWHFVTEASCRMFLSWNMGMQGLAVQFIYFYSIWILLLALLCCVCVYMHVYWWFQNITCLMFTKVSKHANVSHIIFKFFNSVAALDIDILMWLAFCNFFVRQWRWLKTVRIIHKMGLNLWQLFGFCTLFTSWFVDITDKPL